MVWGQTIYGNSTEHDTRARKACRGRDRFYHRGSARPGSPSGDQAVASSWPAQTTGPVGPCGSGEPPLGSIDTASFRNVFIPATFILTVPPAGSTPSDTGRPSCCPPHNCSDFSDGLV